MKKIIKDVEHIKRNFDMSVQHRLRYDEDNYRFEILKYDRAKEHFMKASDMGKSRMYKTENAKFFTGLWDSNWFICSPKGAKIINDNNNEDDDDSFNIIIDFDITEASKYRVDVLYRAIDTSQIEGDEENDYAPSLECSVDGEVQVNMSRFYDNPFMFSRQQYHIDLKQGSHEIIFKGNCYIKIYGFTVRGYDVYTGSKGSHDDLVLNSATVTLSESIKADELEMNIMYFNELREDEDLATNLKNRSGYIFDYRDEVNFYVTDKTGVEQQVFGGYISTVKVDDDKTEMTINCAGRLIDGEHRIMLSQMELLGGEDDDTTYETTDTMHTSFETRGEALQYISNSFEVPLQHTNLIGNNDFEHNFTKKILYGSDYENEANWYVIDKSEQNWTSDENITATEFNDGILLRNGTTRSQNSSYFFGDDDWIQEFCFYSDKEGVEISPTAAQNFWMEFGLGEEMWTDGDSSGESTGVGEALLGNDCTDTNTMAAMHGGTDTNNGTGKDFDDAYRTGYATEGHSYFDWARSFATDKEMLLALRDLFTWTLYYSNQTCPDRVFSTSGIVCNCYDACRLVKVCMDARGGKCVVITGYYHGGHGWNCIDVGDGWKSFDLCYVGHYGLGNPNTTNEAGF